MNGNLIFMKNILISDHKTGHTLSRLYTRILNKYLKNELEFRYCYLFWNFYNQDEKYIIFIRDPREIIISGYLHHKRCNETTEIWANRINGDYYENWNIHHFLQKEMKKNFKYLNIGKHFSIPMPYKTKLNMLSQEEGIIYEMHSVAKLTITGMYNLIHYGKKNVITIDLDDLTFNFNSSIEKICKFLDIEKSFSEEIRKYLLEHNTLNLKKKDKLPYHTTNIDLQPKRYKKYWTEKIQKEFEKLFPKDILSKFNFA